MADAGPSNPSSITKFFDIDDLDALQDVVSDYFTPPPPPKYSSDDENSEDEDENSDNDDLNAISNLTKSKQSDDGNIDEQTLNELDNAISELQEDIEETDIREELENMSDEDLKTKSGCRCSSFCLSFMSPELVNEIRANNRALTKDGLDLLLLGKLCVLFDNSKLTNSNSHKAKERKRAVASYKHESECC